MAETTRRLATLWIGGEIGWIEDLALRSMVKTGHEVSLYTYAPLGYVPEGVTVRDAQDVFPTDVIYVHERTKSPSCHSDVFRMMLMQATDEVWMDLDIVMVRPLQNGAPFLFAPEDADRPQGIGNSMLRLPEDSKTLAQHLDFYDHALYEDGPISRVYHGKNDAFSTGLPSVGLDMGIAEFGPPLLSRLLTETGEIEHALPSYVVFPYHLRDTKALLETPYEEVMQGLNADTVGIHLWATRFKNYLTHNRIVGRPEVTFEGFIMKMCTRLRVNYLYLGASSAKSRLQVLTEED